jgi:hypothetical protein
MLLDKFIGKRKDFLYGDTMGFVLLLDQHYLGDEISVKETRLIEDKLFNHISDQKEIFFLSIHLCDMANFQFRMVQKGTKKILQY